MSVTNADVAELADALDLGSSGRPWGFKSSLPHQKKLNLNQIQLFLFLFKSIYKYWYNFIICTFRYATCFQNYTLNKSCEQFLERFKHFYNIDENNEAYIRMFEYSKLSLKYYQKQSEITMMFHLLNNSLNFF